jgi:hypothetical protein
VNFSAIVAARMAAASSDASISPPVRYFSSRPSLTFGDRL